MEDLSGEALFEEVQDTLERADAEVSGSLSVLEKAGVEKVELIAQRAVLSQIESLDVSLGAIGAGSFVHSFLGLGPKNDYMQPILTRPQAA